jgi:hypothetical protein
MNLDKCKSLLPHILDQYIRDAVDTRTPRITYKVEYISDKGSPTMNEAVEKEESNCRVRVYKVSIGLYVKAFNLLFDYDFDEWLFSRLIHNKVKVNNKQMCTFPLTFDRTSFDQAEIEDIADTIKGYMTISCYPFAIFRIRLRGISDVSHANTLLVEFSEDFSNIVMTYYEPHGSDAFIHKMINIHYLLELVKEKLMDDGKTSVRISWGCEMSGIQKKDKLGLCMVFNRFWTYINLQLLKNCKGMKDSNGFIEPLTREGERYVTGIAKQYYPLEPDKDYDIIITWMYRIILEFMSDNNQNVLRTQIEIMLKQITTDCNKPRRAEQCSVSEENWPMSRCYTEFINVDIPKPKSVKKREAYISKLLGDVQHMDTSD